MHPSRSSRQLAVALLTFATLLPLSPARAKLPSPRQEWVEVRMGSIPVLTNGGERKAREVAASLVRFRQALGQLKPGTDLEPPVPTWAIVFKSDRSFRPYKMGSGSRRKYLAGQFQPGQYGDFILLNGFPAQGSALPVVYHEYVHAFLRANFSGIPLWLQEGLAEYYSTFAMKENEIDVGKPVERHVQYLRGTSFIPLERLFAVTYDSPEYNEGDRVGTFYAES